jgi:glycosyltransferase involved in cell wall biosynthesis
MAARPEGRPLVVGPLPPPVGGIATIVAKLAEAPDLGRSIQFLDTRKAQDETWLGRLIRPARLSFQLNRRLRRRPRCALVFCSAHGSFWEKGLWLLMARGRGVPMMVMMVDGRFPEFYQSLAGPMRNLARWLLETFHVVLVQTESWRHFYSEIGPRGNYVVLPNGVDCNEFTPVEREPSESPTVLFVGWLIPEKGVFDLIDAARILRDRRAGFLLRLVGPFHGNESAVHARIAAAGLTDVVHAVGPLHSRHEILDAYHDADIFALPSWAEGLPVAVLEAMACGLPVVASSVGGTPDLLQDGVSGLLVPPRDPAALADALERLLRDRNARLSIGRAARTRVESKFSSEVFIKGVMSLLTAARADEGAN